MTIKEKEENLLLCFKCISIQDVHERVRSGKRLTNLQIRMLYMIIRSFQNTDFYVWIKIAIDVLKSDRKLSINK